jgi:hypothetical protein
LAATHATTFKDSTASLTSSVNNSNLNTGTEGKFDELAKNKNSKQSISGTESLNTKNKLINNNSPIPQGSPL